MAPQLIDKNGVTVYIYGKEHNPPHIHASYGEDEALIDIRTGKIFEGYISNKKLKVVQDWLNKGETKQIVEENFYELNPRLRPKEPNEIKKNKRKTKGGK
ncbi:MAG TPA: DUF4160 domain-containing protein [Bacteroidia bacterium]|nr:DUF4160 domain-containing protein [Bacteroidia bacterium]